MDHKVLHALVGSGRVCAAIRGNVPTETHANIHVRILLLTRGAADRTVSNEKNCTNETKKNAK